MVDKLSLIFTLDYEIHGNGEGCPDKLMVKPTYRLMNYLEKYNAKLVIFADMAEIIKFKEYYQRNNVDKFHYLKIKKQLQNAVIKGHDVQLHIHSSYFNADYSEGKWNQSWEEYHFAGLEYKKIYERIKQCKEELESMIKEKVPDYKCYAFRAANWAMQPTRNIALALLENGIFIDSSVHKGGKQSGWVSYDYSNAYSGTFPYKSSINEICEHDRDSRLWEFPIYCELRSFWHFISPIRIFRMIRAKRYKHKENPAIQKTDNFDSKRKIVLKLINKRFPRKFDFNQLSGRQMIKQIKQISENSSSGGYVILSGHSKSFIWYNSFTLTKFLRYLSAKNNRYIFSLFPHIDKL